MELTALRWWWAIGFVPASCWESAFQVRCLLRTSWAHLDRCYPPKGNRCQCRGIAIPPGSCPLAEHRHRCSSPGQCPTHKSPGRIDVGGGHREPPSSAGSRVSCSPEAEVSWAGWRSPHWLVVVLGATAPPWTRRSCPQS